MPSSPDGSHAARPRATARGAFVDGWRRALRAPWLAAGVLVATLVVAAPLAAVLDTMIRHQLGSSLVADRVVSGWDAGWATEFHAQAQGVGQTFTDEILGFGGTLATLSDLVDKVTPNPAIAGAIGAYLLLWMFLSGGVLDRLARARPIRARAFFAACGGYLVRFVRLGVVVGAAYWALFRWLHPYLFGTLYDRWTRDMTVEGHAVVLRAILYAVFLAALAGVSVVSDFAKVRLVVEDRRSVLAALAAAVRFIRRRFWRVAGLYLLNTAAFVLILAVWFAAAPSASAPLGVALLVAQVYLLARIVAKLAFAASEIAFFQGELAHAGYTASPRPVWPDSPAEEAIRRLTAATGQRAEGHGQREGRGQREEEG
jgi:hypothetical protein